MRRRIPYRVCSCTSTGVVTHIEARLLRSLVNRELHPLRCARSCRRKRMRAMNIGDLCAESGHFGWALRVWWLGLDLICSKDYDEWRYVWFNTRVVRLSDVVSEEDACILGRRIDSLWRSLGYPDMALAEVQASLAYDWLWLEKYDHDRTEWATDYVPELRRLECERATESLFLEGQCDWQPAQSQDFFHYWDNTVAVEDFSFLDGE